MKRKLFVFLFIVLICSCKRTISYYEIPIVNQVLAIYTPTFSDYAYVYIDAHQLNTIKDSIDFKLYRDETTEVSLIFSKQKNDTIFYSDRWDDVVSITKAKKYKKIRWHDSRFYIKNEKTNKYYINQNYIEVVIKANATFVVYQLNNSYRILEPISSLE